MARLRTVRTLTMLHTDLSGQAPTSVPLRELHTTPLLQAETPPDKTELSLPPPWVIATLPAETPVEGAPPTDDRRERLVTMFQFFLRESF
ncbi:hypothetical protein MTO96_028392 [Rhipicephalus appendiculatus]